MHYKSLFLGFRLLFLFLVAFATLPCESFSQFHMEVGARVGNSLIHRDMGKSYTGVISRLEEKCKFGQSFGLDCTVGYDVRNLFGVTSGLSFDYLRTQEGSGGWHTVVWDVPEDQIPHLPEVYTREEYQAYMDFCQAHSRLEMVPVRKSRSYVSMLTIPIELNKSIRLFDFCTLRPTAGLGNTFVLGHKVYNSAGPFSIDYKTYVPTLLAGLDVLFAERWIVGVHIRRDMSHFASPSWDYFDESLRTRQLTVKLGWRIF